MSKKTFLRTKKVTIKKTCHEKKEADSFSRDGGLNISKVI